MSDAYDHASEVAMPRVVRVAGLRPESSYEVEGASVRTLARPPGAHLSSFATVNDVHFGEVECGVLEGFETGPILSVGPGEVPYPQMMNRCAVEEISDLAPDAVLAKGDLTTIGTREEYQTFLDCYRAGFGDRLHFVRGNHDAMSGLDFGLDAPRELELDGVRLAILDTVIPGRSNGQVSSDQLEWLDELGARSDRPVLVFGHHHVWDPSSHNRPLEYFGVNPDDS
ncbi:MAG: metallophosphoesterase family protein, partial [Mycobacterium sp.]